MATPHPHDVPRQSGGLPRWIACALALWLAGCRPEPTPVAQQTAPPDPGILATVGTRTLHATDLELELARRRERGSQPDPAAVLEEMIQREALLAHARQLGLDRDPGVVRSWENLLIAKLKDRALAETPLHQESSPPPATATTNPRTTRPAATQIRLAILRQELPRHSSESRRTAALQRLESARTQARELVPELPGFGRLALEFSDDDATRYQGGDLGWLPEDASRLRHDPAMLRAAFALQKVGDLSPVLQGRDGLYLVRLLGRRSTPALDSAETDENLAPDTRDRARRAELALRETVRKQVPIRLHRDPASLGPAPASELPPDSPASPTPARLALTP